MGSKKKKTYLARLDDILSKASAYGEDLSETVPATRDLIEKLRRSKNQDNLDLIELGLELGVLLAKMEIKILDKRPEDL